MEKAPIITSEKKSTNQTFQFGSDGVKVSSSESSGGAGILDRNAFVKILNDTNKGLARPKLLILINQYELLVYLEENTEKESEQWKKATTKKVEIENALFKEIQYGYEDTMQMKQVFDTNIIDFARQNGFEVEKGDCHTQHVKGHGGLYLFNHGRGFHCFTTEKSGNIIDLLAYRAVQNRLEQLSDLQEALMEEVMEP